VFAVFDHLHAVDENVFHSGRVLVRFIERRVIGDCFRIEHDDVGEHSFFQHAAMIELEILRRLRAQAPDRFAACKFSPEDFRIGATAYTPDKYLQVGFDGSSARAVSMLKDRLNEARQIAGNIGGSALTEVQRQSRVLDYFSCRLKIEQASEK